MAHSREGRVTTAPCLWGSCSGPAQPLACTEGLLVASTGTLEGLGVESLNVSVGAEEGRSPLLKGGQLSLS